LQTISLLAYLKESDGVVGPSLVVCPLSVLSSWCNEIQKWAPSLKYFRLHASNPQEQHAQRQILSERACDYDIIVTTYEMAKVPVLHSLYARLHFNYLVLDEGHKIKGHTTEIAQSVRKIHSENRLLLTGTPLQNNLVELWSLLNFLYPEVFTTSEPFEKAFNLKDNIVDKTLLGYAQKLLDLFMLRRLKSEVEKLMPQKIETKVCTYRPVHALE
jgi:SWI/SNF-related matrix-associated actin-dependent regulator of chromatin subfamily A member 5